MESSEAASISVLPVGCISDIIMLNKSPRDACTASAVSVGFKSAADSDAVWERFLPPDYQEIIVRSVSPLVYHTKKQLYFRLSDSHILLDGGRMSFSLDKRSGKKCCMLRARELSIAWQDDLRYWRWGPLLESRFSEVVELLVVCWLDIRGQIGTQMLSLKTTYAAYLVYKTTEDSWGLSDPSKTIVRLVRDGAEEDGVEAETHTAYLKTPWHAFATYPNAIPQENDRQSRIRTDGWMEIELGEFFYDEGDDGEVVMQLKEIELLSGKRGLIVEGMELRPKENV